MSHPHGRRQTLQKRGWQVRCYPAMKVPTKAAGCPQVNPRGPGSARSGEEQGSRTAIRAEWVFSLPVGRTRPCGELGGTGPSAGAWRPEARRTGPVDALPAHDWLTQLGDADWEVLD